MPTTGQARSFGFERAVRRADFECADPLRLGFVREDDALRFRSRFALMAVVHVSGPRSLYKLRFPMRRRRIRMTASGTRKRIESNRRNSFSFQTVTR